MENTSNNFVNTTETINQNIEFAEGESINDYIERLYSILEKLKESLNNSSKELDEETKKLQLKPQAVTNEEIDLLILLSTNIDKLPKEIANIQQYLLNANKKNHQINKI
jgi:hypothetical protein